MLRVAGKIAYVTGGASGIGLAVARRLVLEGATVIAADINEEAGVRACGGNRELQFMRHDVRSESHWKVNLEQVLSQFGRLDILVNVAGITKVADIEQETLDDWQRLFNVNANGAFLACHYGVKAMRRCKAAGSIVIVSSPMAMRPASYLVSYAASKAVGVTLTKSVALHCAQQQTGIRCNAVLPGSVHTGVMEDYLSQVPDRQKALRDAAAMMPINRLCEADEVALAVLYLASDESAIVTGAVLAADGGYSIA
jgi:3(or 17)beta-hydroxysteroid dehydrogenase